MTIAYIDPTLAVDDTTAIGWPFIDGQAYTPVIAPSKGTGVIYSTMAAAYSALGGSNHQFYCRRGFYHNRTGAALFSSFITKTGCTFSDYGIPSAFKPILDGHIYHSPTAASDALWTHSGSGVWYIELASASNACRAFRTDVGSSGNSNTFRSLGQYWNPALNASSVASVNDGFGKSIWFGESSGAYRITVYTGSTTQAPPTYYNGIAISQSGSGVANGIAFRNGGINNRVSNFEIRGTSNSAAGTLSFTTAGVSNISFSNMDYIACNKNVIVVTSAGASGYYARGISFLNSTIDVKTGVGAASKDNYTVDFQNDDIVNIADACEGILVHNVKIRCGTVHSIFNISPDLSSNPTQFPSGIILSDIDAEFNSDTIDGRTLGIDNVKGCIIIGLKSRNPSTKSQLHGQNIYVTGCDFGPIGYNSDPSNQRFLLELTNFPLNIAPLNVNIINNTFQTAGAAILKGAIGINTYSTAVAGWVANSLCISNNLGILDTGDAFVIKSPYNAAADSAKPISNTQQILNNYVCRPDGSAGLATTGNGTGEIQTGIYVANQPLNGFMNSSANIGGTVATATLNSDSIPTTGSPLIGAGVGVVSLTDALSGGAFTFALHRDFTGKYFKNIPTIGAYEVGFSRTLKT